MEHCYQAMWCSKCQLQTGICPEHCQQLNNKDICHLHLWRLNPMLLQLLTFTNPSGNSGWSEGLSAPGNLVGQVFRWLDAFRNRFYDLNPCIFQFSSVQSHSLVQLFATQWTAARQASLSITNSQSLLKLTSIESVMPSNHFILCRPLLLLPSIFPSIMVFSSESVVRIRWPKYWSFSFSISPSKEALNPFMVTLDPHG